MIRVTIFAAGLPTRRATRLATAGSLAPDYPEGRAAGLGVAVAHTCPGALAVLGAMLLLLAAVVLAGASVLALAMALLAARPR